MTEPTPAPAPTPTPAPTPAATPAPAPVAIPELLSIDEFKRLELRTAKVTAVEVHPNADRLYVVKVDVGGTPRQVVAGIKQFYTPEQLVGKTVIVVVNLKPAKLRGVESQGMILAVAAGENLSVLTTEREVASGLRVS